MPCWWGGQHSGNIKHVKKVLFHQIEKKGGEEKNVNRSDLRKRSELDGKKYFFLIWQANQIEKENDIKRKYIFMKPPLAVPLCIGL